MGWSNLIPNPFIVGGAGVSGEILVYDAASILLASINSDGITFYDVAGNEVTVQDDDGITITSAATGTDIQIRPAGGSGNPELLFSSINSDPGEYAAIYVLDFIVPENGAGIEMTTTEYTQTVLGGTVRQVARVGPNWSEIYVVGAGGTHHGGAVGVDDAQGRVYAAPANVIVAEVVADVVGTVYALGTDYVWIDGWNDVFIDGPVTLDSVLTCAPTAGAASQQIVFNEGYSVYADNTGAGAANSRLWIDSPDGGQVVIGPRAGASYLDDLRLRTDATTAAAANCFIDSTTQQIMRSTSSLRYKTDIHDAEFDPVALLSLRPVRFHDRGQLAEMGPAAPWHVGFIAEELDALGLGDFVYHDSTTGQAESVQYDRLTAGLICLVKDLYDRVRYLERGQAA